MKNLSKKICSACLAFCLGLAFCSAQSNIQFPDVAGETLSGKSISVPQALKGKVSIVGLAYSQKSDQLLKDWYNPIYSTFIEPPEVSFLPIDKYDIHTYFVALVKGIYKTADGKIMGKMKSGINTKFHPNTVVYMGNIQEYKSKLKLTQKDHPYFFVLDENGKIIYHTSGPYSERKLDDLIRAVNK